MARSSNYLVEIQAHTGDQVETLYLSTQPITTGPTDTPANQKYIAAVNDLGKFDRSFAEDDGTFGPQQVNYGFIGLSNANGQFDGWQFYGFGRSFVIKDLVSGRARAVSAPVIFSGVIHGVDTTDAKNVFRLRVRDRMALLDLPLLTTRYAGTTLGSGATAEGDADLTDTIKPRIWGAPYEVVKCILVNRFNLLYQVSASVVDSIVVYDQGVALTGDGDNVDLTALNAASISAGHYRTCLALGIFRLGASPAGAVTAHVVEGGSAENRSAARVAERMLTEFGESLDSDSFDALYAAIDDQVGLYIDDDSSALINVARVLGSIEAGVVPTADQTLQAVRLVDPGLEVSVDTLTEDDLDKDGAFAFTPGPLREGDGIPASEVVVNWGVIFAPQSGGDLAGSVSDERRAILGLQKRTAVAPASGVVAIHPNAKPITAETLLIDATDAANAAARRVALYGTTHRRLTTFPVARSRADYPIGTILTIDMARYGFAGGLNSMVIGRQDDFTKRLVTYRLWG